MAERRFAPGVGPRGEPSGEALVFAFRERHLLVRLADGGPAVPTWAELEPPPGGSATVRRQYLGTLDGRAVFSAELAAEAEPEGGFAVEGLRALHGRLDDELFWLAARAAQIVDWDRDHQFCSRCGGATEDHPTDRAKRCPRCALVQYPRLAPAAIVLVERGDEMLLARSPHFAPGVYSTLAGFVETGESLEETVAREIREEVGVEVRDVRYFGSQPWPFPHSLMVGFRADWAAGELVWDGQEIEDAGWFRWDRPPALPSKASIARSLIEAFLAERRAAVTKV